MYRVLSCISDQHDSGHVILAILICALSAVCTVFVFHRGQVSTSEVATRIWASVAGSVTGLGIWATHFVAMLGYQPGFDVSYDGVTTAISSGIAVIGFIGTSQILINGMTPARRIICAVIATTTVAVMHYYGMTALRGSAIIEYDYSYVWLSITLSGGLFIATYTFGLSETHKYRNLIGLLTTLGAVASLHFVGASALSVVPVNGLQEISWSIGTETLGIWVSLAVALILISAVLAAGFDSFVTRFNAASQKKMSMLANSAVEGLFIVSQKGEIVEVNDAGQHLLGMSHEDIVGQNAASLLSLNRHFVESSDGVVDWGERKLLRADGAAIAVEVSKQSLSDKGQEFAVVVVRDLTQRLAHEAEIRSLAYNDQLTGLANRTAFQKAVDAALSANADSRVGVLLFDIDEFKSVNDQYGHDVGDQLLQDFAQKLRSVSPNDYTLARLGGDEFAILIPGFETFEALEGFAQTCVEVLAEKTRCAGRLLPAAASIGVAWSNPQHSTFATLMKAADRALYAAKDAGRTCYRLYDEELHQEQEFRRELESDLHLAVERDEFELHYQPKVDAKGRRIVGYEALIRWNRPGFGLVSPDTFIPIAEQSDLINVIGAWTIRQACNQATHWNDDITVSVNLSGRQFLDANLLVMVEQALAESGLPAERLELEITETALVRNAIVAAQILNKLKALGVTIALDDFGTGYSSMSYVQQFEFDRIKIDKSFVGELGKDRKATSIIETIAYLGQALSIPIVAEGVETEEQAKYLLSIRCNELQGFLISKPVSFSNTLERSKDATSEAA